MVYTLRFFNLKCSLFHNSNLFGSCIIHILYTECAKIKKIIPDPKGYLSKYKKRLPILERIQNGFNTHGIKINSIYYALKI